MKQLLTNPIVVNLEIGLVMDIINLINKASHGFPHEIVENVKARILLAKQAAEQEKSDEVQENR